MHMLRLLQKQRSPERHVIFKAFYLGNVVYITVCVVAYLLPFLLNQSQVVCNPPSSGGSDVIRCGYDVPTVRTVLYVHSIFIWHHIDRCHHTVRLVRTFFIWRHALLYVLCVHFLEKNPSRRVRSVDLGMFYSRSLYQLSYRRCTYNFFY